MALLNSLKNLFSFRSRARALYKRGMEKAKRDDWSGAIDDYTAAIGGAAPSDDVKAMAAFNPYFQPI